MTIQYIQWHFSFLFSHPPLATAVPFVPSGATAVPFIPSGASLASRHMKQTIYDNIVFLSTLTFNNSYIITLFPTYCQKENLRQPPTLTMLPPSHCSSSNL
jgi:hypothetical protein